MFTRRSFLRAAGVTSAALATTGLPARALAGPADRRFLFVHARGGWDVRRAFGDGAGWATQNAGVDAFFRAHADHAVTVHGLRASSLAHGLGAAALLGSDGRSLGAHVGDHLDLIGESAAPAGLPRARRAADAASAPGGPPLGGDKVGHGDSDADWSADALAASFDQGDADLLQATRALCTGRARCATVAWPAGPAPWDTHIDSDTRQDLLFDGLFSALADSAAALRAAPGVRGSMLDDTVVVVVSELGRSPQLNNLAGRDHWPITSALLFGGGLRGRVIGSDADTRPLSAVSATVLELAGARLDSRSARQSLKLV